MAILFPSNPTTGDTFTAVGKTWTWNGAQWEGVPAVVSSGIPSGETADRPASPAIGDQFYNGTLGVLEIYTTSGWLPATGANDFNVVLNGEDTSVILDKEYFSGAYTISSALSDTSFDIYLFDTQGNSAGYTKSPSINATSNFNKIVVLGGQAGDLLSFSYKTTFATASITDEVTAGPIIKSISVADLPNIDDTTVITGINFAEDIQVTFTGTNDVGLSAKSVVRSSATSLVITRPDNLIEDYSPYTVTVTNPGIISPTGSSGHISTNAITAGGDPIWVTASGALSEAIGSQQYSATLQATDPDGGSISYSIISGQIPSGLSLNSTTGEIAGVTAGASQEFIVAATDSGGNVTNRTFSISVVLASGGTVSSADGYTYHTFTSNGTFEPYSAINADILVVAGGGSGGWQRGGGGGAGGMISVASQPFLAQQYQITIGAGGVASNIQDLNRPASVNGEASAIAGIASATGGGQGGLDGSGSASNGLAGGSGGGASAYSGADPGTGIQGQGNRGGNYTGLAPNYGSGGGGGAGAVGNDGTGTRGGDGGAGSQWLDGNYYAGGGGGGSYAATNTGGAGGIGGGGNAGGYTSTAADGSPGSPNTGGGGGGGINGVGSPDRKGGNGGSGIVIIRYA
jgi:hypothetical protein